MAIAEWGAIGELIGAIAVVITVAYLAVQIRQAQRTMVSTTQQNISDTSVQLFAVTGTSESLSEALDKATRDQPLSEVEKQRVRGWWSAALRHAENMHYQWEQGMLPPDLIDASGKRLANGLLSMPYAMTFWRAEDTNHRSKFADWMNAAIASQEKTRRDRTPEGPK